MAKEPSAPPLPDGDVDMDHIREMMGPLPNEAAQPPAPKTPKAKKAKKIKITHHADLDKAAEEANQALMAMSPDLGDATITKLDDETPETAPADEPAAPDVSTDGTAGSEVASTEPAAAEEAAPVEPAADTISAPELPDAPEVSEPDIASDADTPATPAAPDEPDLPPLPDDAQTERAVDDIIAAESDKLLAAEDREQMADAARLAIKEKRSFRHKLQALLVRPKVRWALFAAVAVTAIGVALVPASRYFVLNNVGIRSSLSLNIIDSSSLQPLKNVEVSVHGQSALTDNKGNVRLDHLRLGPATVVIQKRAFATSHENIVIGWGSNPLGQRKVSPVGNQYTFKVTDFLSGQPLEGAEAASGEGNAVADKDGKIILTLDTANKPDNEQFEVTITASSYRSEKIVLTINNKETQSVAMAPASKHTFISKRSGKYDVYTIDVDGKNEKRIVAGTGLERDDLTLIPLQNGDLAAYVATRENVRNAQGYLLSTLYIIDLNDGSLLKIDQSEQVHIIGWAADGHLLYVKIAAGSSAANPKRQRLMSFNSKDITDVQELASANYFNDVIMAGDTVFYAPASAFQDAEQNGYFSVRPDGSARSNLMAKEVWNIFRTDYDTLHLSSQQDWYKQALGSKDPPAKTDPPSSRNSRVYVDSPSKDRSLWVDSRDGKDLLLVYAAADKSDKTIVERRGIKNPVYWLNGQYVVYRVNDGKETADYVINLQGGSSKKIQDVTDANGVDRWYYY